MNETCKIVLRSLLDTLTVEQKELLLHYLPQETATTIRKLPKSSLKKTAPTEQSLLNVIHVDYLIPIIRQHLESDRVLLLEALSKEVRGEIQSQLHQAEVLLQLHPLAKTYFQQVIMDKLIEKNTHFVPPCILSDSPFNELLSLSKSQFTHMISLLAMHDVNAEIRTIIDKAKLKSIFETLSKEQLHYLNSIQKSPEKVLFKKMNLSNAMLKTDLLQKLLWQRGLNRLAKAVSLESTSLLWYISQRLSINDAALFEKLLDKNMNGKALEALQTDLSELLTHIPKSFEAAP